MRTINSPGVQITEKDLSLRLNSPVGTNILVPGFAAQGPVNEPVLVTSVSELEGIYGTPTNAAERYFYYSCKEILNSPGVLTTVRLPYGPGNGVAFSKNYSALFYPMTNGWNPTLSAMEWRIGAPIHKTLDHDEYSALLHGDFEWKGTANGAAGDEDGIIEVGTAEGFPVWVDEEDGEVTVDYSVTAGFVVINDLQTVINESHEGYYVGFADNSSVYTENTYGSLASPDFDSIRTIQTLVSADNMAELNSDKIDFAVSSTKAESDLGVHSVSELLEKVGFKAFETKAYQDYLSFGVFRVRRSTSDPSLLTLGTVEKYIGSFDFNRKAISPTGGTPINAYIEEAINDKSPTVKVLVNPEISKVFDWTANDSTLPTCRITIDEHAKQLFPLGTYAPDTRAVELTKVVGNVPTKLERSLRLSESVENNTVDIVLDAGLSTVFAATYGMGPLVSGDRTSIPGYDDEKYVSIVGEKLEYAQESWLSIAIPLINFAESTRKDCMAIIDPPRFLFLRGKDTKVIEQANSNFTLDIYEPLKKIAAIDSNYCAMYANWVKIFDGFSGRKFWCPFSGYAASIYAKNDAVAQPWSAPAGLNRGTFNVLDIAINPNLKQRDKFYELSVNPVCFFTGDGYVVMGQKTLQVKPTAFDRVNVRRLFLTLERAVSRTLKYFVFEPNTEFTRTRIVNTITPIFEFAKNTQGLYDYLIVADSRNNTPDTIDNNELIVDIYIKPVRTAEFILVNFIATRTGQNFAELI